MPEVDLQQTGRKYIMENVVESNSPLTLRLIMEIFKMAFHVYNIATLTDNGL